MRAIHTWACKTRRVFVADYVFPPLKSSAKADGSDVPIPPSPKTRRTLRTPSNDASDFEMSGCFNGLRFTEVAPAIPEPGSKVTREVFRRDV